MQKFLSLPDSMMRMPGEVTRHFWILHPAVKHCGSIVQAGFAQQEPFRL
ncbi:MAG TPA: hypothetical protein VFG81_13240 [Anaerolineales bacterium]|nr:hypothetical protein [Anaerolineales bacterium]